VGRSIADHSRTIRIPVHMVEVVSRLGHVSIDLIQRLGREPAAGEAALMMGLFDLKTEETLIGTICPDLEPADWPDPARRARLLDDLPEREAQILELRFGLHDGRPRTLEEVGREFGVTRERIRQIEEETLLKLRHPKWAGFLRDFLD